MRRLASIAATAVLTAGMFAALPATPALAAWEHCEAQDWCMWDHYEAGGDVYYNSLVPVYDGNLVDDGWNDRVNSLSNRTGKVICVYSDVNFSGHSLRILPGRQVNLAIESPKGHYWRDKMSSYRQIPSTITSCVFD